MSTGSQGSGEDLAMLTALRQRQQREAARGCLLVLVLEGAAILAVVLWLLAMGLGMPRLRLWAGGAFLVFTLAAAAAGLMLLVQGNLPGARRLRRDHAEASRRRQDADSVAGDAAGE
jgi:hypothetical protein